MKLDQSNQRVFDQYLSARNDFLNGKYKLATKKLLPINLVTDNDDVNHLLVRSLYHQNDYKGAMDVLLPSINSYTSSPKLITLMIKILLKNDEFIICHEIIPSFQDDELKQRLLTMVKSQESIVKKRKPDVLTKIAKKFYHLSGVSLIQQRIVLKKAQRLPLNTFLKIAKTLLIDPFLAPIMRLSVLDILRKVDYKATVKYRWIDQQIYFVDVTRLTDLESTQSYRQVMRVIDSKYFHNPSQMVALKQILRLDLSYLYPFNDQKVRDAALWVKIASQRLQGKQPIFLNQHIKSIYFLQVKLNQLTKNLIK